MVRARSLRIVDHLRCRFARFDLCAHLLQAHGKRINLLCCAAANENSCFEDNRRSCCRDVLKKRIQQGRRPKDSFGCVHPRPRQVADRERQQGVQRRCGAAACCSRKAVALGHDRSTAADTAVRVAQRHTRPAAEPHERPSELHQRSRTGRGRFRRASTLSPMDLIGLVSTQPLAFPPGLNYASSNTDNTVVALFAEMATGLSYELLLYQLVFDPLHLRRTSCRLGSACKGRSSTVTTITPPESEMTSPRRSACRPCGRRER